MESRAPFRPIRHRPQRLSAFALFALLGACAQPHDDRPLVANVISAVAAGTTETVARDFTADGQRQLRDRVRLNAAREDLAPLGHLREIVARATDRSPLPSVSGSMRREAFTAVFAAGTRRVDVTLDPSGKIAALWIRQPVAASAP